MPLTPGLLRSKIGGWFVSPTGGTGAGTITDPWSISHALSGAGGVIQPGDTVWLRGGTYTGSFTNTINGTAASPIIVRQYPSEQAEIIGVGDITLNVLGSYTWFRGFTVIGGSATVTCVALSGTHNKAINLVTHDGKGVGISMFQSATGGESYGCINYNHGPCVDNPTCAGDGAYTFYLNNTNSAQKLIRDNIGFNCYGAVVQLQGTAGQLEDILLSGNVWFGGHAIKGVVGNTLAQGGSPATNLQYLDNHLYEGHSTTLRSWAARLGVGGTNFTLRRNHFTGLTRFESALVSNGIIEENVFYSLGPSTAGGDLLEMVNSSGISSWATNTHYRLSTALAWKHAGVDYNFADWKIASGLGATDTNPAAAPVGTEIFLRPNLYEAKRANIIIYNWDSLANVSVDLSSILAVGDAYEIRNAQVWFDTPVASGTYGGGSVSIPMAAVTPPTTLYGRTYVAPPLTGPIFQVFVVRLQGA